MKQPIRALLLATVGLMFLAGRAIAQDDRGDDNPQDHTCDKAARILAKGHPAKKEQWALGLMVKCAGGAAALAGLWSPLPTDSTALFALASSSRSVGDVRVLNAALAVVQNASISQATRRVAINVVLAEYAPAISLGNANWADPEHTSLGLLSDVYQRAGEQPVTAADRQRVVAAFVALSTAEPNPLLRRVAAMIARELNAVCDGKPCYLPSGSGPK